MIKFIASFLLLALSFQLRAQLTEKEIFVVNEQDTLWGTLTTPQLEIDTNQACVLIIAGSGPTDRDGNNNIMKNNSLKMIAHDLSKMGISSIRYDKRGVGSSFGAYKNESDLTFEDNVMIAGDFYDLAVSFGYSKLFIAGHSEGSLIGILLSEKKSPYGFISIAGAGRPIQHVLKEQYEATAPIVRDSAHVVIDILASGKRIDTLSPWLYSVFRPSIQPYIISWMQYNPVDELKKLTCPVLVLQGDQDIQVSTEDAYALTYNDSIELHVLDGMNHVLKKVGTDLSKNRASYNDPTLPLHEDLIFSIGAFIKKR